jgi:S-DNA-T family DNA segregation ATPase FtsK/SpoIIIE
MRKKAVRRITRSTDQLSNRIAYPLGIVLIGLGLYLTLALLSYHGADPSANHAVDNDVHNLAGSLGSYLADPMLQLLGLGASLLGIIPVIWGIRLIVKKQLPNFLLRVPALLFASVAFAGFLATVPFPESWPFLTFGGFIGEYLHVESSVYLGKLGFLIFVLALSSSTTILALGLNWEETKIAAQVIAKGMVLGAIGIRYGALATWNFLPRLMFWREKKVVPKRPVKDDSIVEMKKEPAEAPKPKRPAVKQTSLKLSDGYIELPDLDLLKPAPAQRNTISQSALSQNARLLEQVLTDFGVQGKIIKVRPGPVVTLYELEPAAGTKSSRVISLADDIARSMSAVSARIAVVPGKNVIGIELPNVQRETVYLRELLENPAFDDKNIKLPIALGKDIGGETTVVDLAKMPHLLVAGTTGSGKSVAVNTMIVSLLYRLKPEECRFIMIDPKMLELSVYDGIPHLLSPVVTEPGKAVVALKWTVKEMENRYRLMSTLGVRNVQGYNKRIEEAGKKGEVLERTVQTGFDPDTGKPIYEAQAIEMKKMPFIVVIVDEMADLMLVAGKEIEGAIQRLAQMARAAGIHIIMATQRPSVDVITGVIKANFPTRISFQVTSRIDSRTILGEMGAEQLLGMGDMLYMAGGSKTIRVHGAFVDDKEVNDIVAFLKSQGAPDYVEEVTEADESGSDPLAAYGGTGSSGEGGSDAELYDQAVAVVLRDKKASTSYIQRKLRIGYNRAAMLIEQMEEQGVISAPNHAGKREVLVGEDA